MKKTNKKIILFVMILCLFSILGVNNIKALTIKSNSPLYAYTFEGNQLRIVYHLKDSTGDIFCVNSKSDLPQIGDIYDLVDVSDKSAALLYIIKNAGNLTMKPLSGTIYTNHYWAADDVENNSNLEQSMKNSNNENASLYIKQQLAVWYLLDGEIYENGGTLATNTITENVKLTYPGLEDLINNANKQSAPPSKIDVTFSGSSNIVLAGDYYESSLLTVSSTPASTISLSVSPSSAKIYDENGKEISGTIQSGTKIKIAIPSDSINEGQTTITIKATASDTIEVVNIYQNTTDSTRQKIAKVESKTISGSKELTLKITKKVVKISKTDITGEKELPGATLQILDEDGKVVNYCIDLPNSKCEWVSTDEPYEIEGLPNGTYYLVETVAPKGYVLSKEKIKFEIKEDTELEEVVMKNELEVKVPDTLSSRSILLLAIAMFDIALGIGILIYVKKNKA